MRTGAWQRRIAVGSLCLLGSAGCATTRVSDQALSTPPQSVSQVGKPELATTDAKTPGDNKIILTTAQREETTTSSVDVIGGAQPIDAIDLASALDLASGHNPQIGFAQQRIAEACAQLDRADALWLPTLRAGVNYNKHEGAIQDVAGSVFNTSRGALYTGAGAGAVGAASPAYPGLVANFHVTDAFFQPAIADSVASSRQHAASAATNDVLLEVAVAYLELLRATQELANARATLNEAQQLSELTTAFAKTGQGLMSDNERIQTELSLRRNDVLRAEESQQVASARLSQLLRHDPTHLLAPQELTVVPINLSRHGATLSDLVAHGLTNRPELAESQCLVAEAVQRLGREQYAPLLPSVLLGMSYGGFGGGLGSRISNFDNRFDFDAVAYWELRNLGFGDSAVQREACSRLEQARWREVAVMDRVSREVVEANAQVESRRKQIEIAQQGLKSAQTSFEQNLTRIRGGQGLPIEALQSVQALAQARREYLRTVTDHNIAQFTLHRALGWPAE